MQKSLKNLLTLPNGIVEGLLLVHPASAGHSLNLQAGENIIVWFGLPWSLELYQQANVRLYRQGQEKRRLKVILDHQLVHLDKFNTLDEIANMYKEEGCYAFVLDSVYNYGIIHGKRIERRSK